MRHYRTHRAGLQGRMALSYIWVTLLALLLVEMLAWLIVSVVFSSTDSLASKVDYTIQHYATALSAQLAATQLGSVPPLLLGDPSAPVSASDNTVGTASVSIPYINGLYARTQALSFLLLVSPDGHILASSYPRRYSIGYLYTSVLATTDAPLLARVLPSRQDFGTQTAVTPNAVSAMQQVWDRQHRLLGILYMQVPTARLPQPVVFLLGTTSVIGLGFFLLLGIAPLGGIFGWLSTRSLIQRLRRLATATTNFAAGDYHQRVQIARPDEVGQLEQHFNHMADQLVASMARQQELAEQNARLTERTRLSRELHDDILQDLFSLNLFVSGLLEATTTDAPWHTHLTSLKQASLRIVQQMRALLLELRPASLEHLTLNEGLEELAAAYSTRLGIVVTTEISPCQASPEQTHALLSIAREALSNAIRHADATCITLGLTEENELILFTVTDNGKGFTLDQAETRHGMGLRTMQERVQELGGTWIVKSTPGHGTQVQVSLPQKGPSGGR